MSRIFGIDLGTTNSLIAVMEQGAPRVFAEPSAGNALLPSVVALRPDGAAEVGSAAIALETNGDANAIVVRSVKRYMGLGGADLAGEDRRRYAFDTAGAVVRFQAGARAYTPSQISAAILRELKRRAEAVLGGEKVERVVITVPAYFNDGQRQATRDAGRLAGLEVVRLVNEPTAASLAYGLEKAAEGQSAAEGKIAVYDFGGGTFDISILNIKGGIFEVLATNGDTHLGGDDIDRVLVDALLDGVSEVQRTDRHVWNSARLVAEEAKKRLSTAASVDLKLDLPDRKLARTITRAEFERMA